MENLCNVVAVMERKRKCHGMTRGRLNSVRIIMTTNSRCSEKPWSKLGGMLPIEIVEEIFEIFAWTYSITHKSQVAKLTLASRNTHKRIQHILYHTVTITKTNSLAIARTCRNRSQPNPFNMTRHLIIQPYALYQPNFHTRAGIFEPFTRLNAICGLTYDIHLWLYTEPPPAHKLTAAAVFLDEEFGFISRPGWVWTPVNLTHLALYNHGRIKQPDNRTLQDMFPRITHLMLDLTRPQREIDDYMYEVLDYLRLPTIRRILLVVSTATPILPLVGPRPLEYFDVVAHMLTDPRLYYIDIPAPEDPYDPLTAFDWSRWERGSPLLEWLNRAA